MAGGALGALIPPSIVMLIYCQISGLSVGKMFAGGVIPGFILAGLFMTSIAIRCIRKPVLGPPVPPHERADWREKLISLREIVLPIVLIIGVLGSIFGGIATPTEAAAVGAFGAIICSIIYRKFSWAMLKESCLSTFGLFSMVFWIIIGADAFSRFFMAMGGVHLLEGLLAGGDINRWVILIGMQVSIMLLGMILDEWVIVMIAAPIYLPVIVHLGFNPLWFGILFMVNIQMAVLTPPFGYALFYMRALTLKQGDTTMGDIWRSIFHFVPIQAIGLILIMIFPRIALWLPGIVIG
jgi:tripartite ATP-independent transporter DctM subunit